MFAPTYSPDTFNSLDELDGALARFEQVQGSSQIQAIGRVIVGLGLADAIGLTMAHRHFSLGDDERLVEWFEGQFAHLRPFEAAEVAGAIPFAWVIDETGAEAQWRPVEFIRQDQFPRASLPKLEQLRSSEERLNELARQIVSRGLGDVLGIALAHRELPLGDGEILVESLDHSNRTLTFQAGAKRDYENLTLIPTFWKFSDDPDGVVVEAWKHCINH